MSLALASPTSFRRSGATPEGLTFHYAELPESDIAVRNGYLLTTPLRTILDMAKSLLWIVERGLITRRQAKGASIPEATRLQLEALLGWKKR